MKKHHRIHNRHNSVHRLSGYAGAAIKSKLQQGKHDEAEALAVLVDNIGQSAAQNSLFGVTSLEASITNHLVLYHRHYPVEEGDIDFLALWQELRRSPNGESRQ